MKNEKYRDYLMIGIISFGVIAAGLLTFFILFHFKEIRELLGGLVSILMPFIVGVVIAYLLAPFYNMILRNTESGLVKRKFPEKSARSIAMALAVVVSITSALVLVCGLVALVVPSFITSLNGIVNSTQSYMDRATTWLNDFFADNPEMAATAEYYLTNGSTQLMTWLTEKLLPDLQSLTGSVSNGVGSVFSVLFSGIVIVYKVAKNAILGFIVAAYLLIGKTNMLGRCKQMIYGIFKLKTANHIISQCRYIHQVFGGFIRGKLLDSLIMGCICFVGTSLLKIPYPMLISVIIGVTNIIPFFGPFLGAIPCACLVLLNSPVKCVTFVIFVLAIQQFDGNILGPKILGGTTGLSSFWVLFAIILFGGLFGFVGMIIGVPVFAVICSLVDYLLSDWLHKRNMSGELEDYINLAKVEEKNGVKIYSKLKDPTKK